MRVAVGARVRLRLGAAGRHVAETAPPESFFVISALFHYLGPAFASSCLPMWRRLGSPGFGGHRRPGSSRPGVDSCAPSGPPIATRDA